MSPTSTVFYGTFIDLPRTKSSDKHVLSIRHGAIWVSADGTIEGVDFTVANDRDLRTLIRRKGWTVRNDTHTSSLKSKSQAKVHLIRAEASQNEFFFPGFIDTHIHASQYPNAGLFGSSTLLDWLKTYTFPMETSLGNPSIPSLPPASAFRVYNQTITRTLSHGTTYAAYFATIHVPATQLLASLCLQRGQKALIGRVCMDNPTFCPETYRDASAEATVTQNEDVIAHIRAIDPAGTLVKPIITPRFAPTCTAAAMRGLADQAVRHASADGAPLHIQTHISENRSEVDTVREFFPEQRDYASVYDACGLLTPRTILAHGVHLTAAEHELIRARGSKIAHCPASNSALGSGLCPVRRILDAGVTVGLGTDVSGGYSASVLEAVRQACLVSRLVRFAEEVEVGVAEEERARMVVSVEEALYLATRGGAMVVDAADEVGGFEVGMRFDAQLVRLGAAVGKRGAREESPVDVFGWESWHEKVHKWVWNGDDRNVKAVWVNGRLVHSRGDVGEVGGRLLRWVLGLGVVGVGALVAWRYRR
ncbi:atrazine chlorohydrolase/guanine deaminase [Aspergillus ambiguus]|uniref:chlorohydrolase family protein n=1 Tax=Aspergillus ambiguus TaxID=176160 RepID=UPI003CCD4326